MTSPVNTSAQYVTEDFLDHLDVDSGTMSFFEPHTFLNDPLMPKVYGDAIVFEYTPTPAGKKAEEAQERYLKLYAEGKKDTNEGLEAREEMFYWGMFPSSTSERVNEPVGKGTGYITTNTGFGDGGYPLLAKKDAQGIVTEVAVDFMGVFYDSLVYEDDSVGDALKYQEEECTSRVLTTIQVTTNQLYIGDPCYMYDHSKEQALKNLHELLEKPSPDSSHHNPFGEGLGTIIHNVANGTYEVSLFTDMERKRTAGLRMTLIA